MTDDIQSCVPELRSQAAFQICKNKSPEDVLELFGSDAKGLTEDMVMANCFWKMAIDHFYGKKYLQRRQDIHTEDYIDAFIALVQGSCMAYEILVWRLGQPIVRIELVPYTGDTMWTSKGLVPLKGTKGYLVTYSAYDPLKIAIPKWIHKRREFLIKGNDNLDSIGISVNRHIGKFIHSVFKKFPSEWHVPIIDDPEFWNDILPIISTDESKQIICDRMASFPHNFAPVNTIPLMVHRLDPEILVCVSVDTVQFQ